MKLKEIETRKSVRDFTEELLTQEQMDNIISAGLHTPTSFNTQAFKLVVVERKDMNMELHIGSFGQAHVANASHCIFIFSMKKEMLTEEYMKEVMKPYTAEKDLDQMAKVNTVGFKTGAYKNDLAGAPYAIAATMAYEAKANGVASTIFSGFDKMSIAAAMQNTVNMNTFEPLVAISLGFAKEDAVTHDKDVTPRDKVLRYKKGDLNQIV